MNSRQLEQLYDEHGSRVFAFLVNLTGSEHDAGDLLQEVFLRIGRRPRLLMREPRRYLLRAAHNAFVTMVRRESVRRAALEEFGREKDVFWVGDEAEGETRGVLEQLAHLPGEQRAVVHLKIWEKQTFQEVGRNSGISPNTAASRYRYAIDKLRVTARLPSENESA